MADTVIKKDGTVRHKCHDCDRWFDRDEDVVDDDPDHPDYLRCPDCRGDSGDDVDNEAENTGPPETFAEAERRGMYQSGPNPTEGDDE